MNIGIEKSGDSLYILDDKGNILAFLPDILKNPNMRSVFKNLGLLFKQLKDGVKFNGKAKIT